MTHIRSGAGGAVLTLLLLSCASGRPSPVIPQSSCLLLADSLAPRLDTIVVVLPEPISNGFQTQPQSEAERFVARHTLATLVTEDCAGRLLPHLATAWATEDGGRSWLFTLHASSDRIDGAVIDAAFVRNAWDSRRNGGIWPWPAILDVEILDALRVRVRLDSARTTLPREFADPMLAAVVRLGGTNVASSTGEFRFELTARPSAGPVTTTMFLAPASRVASGPHLKIQLLRPGVDPRDALDFPRAGMLSPADVVFTRDTAVLAFGRSRPDFMVSPVAWDRTYVLITPPPSNGDSKAPSSFRRSLAEDVVPGDARPAEAPFWWDTMPCTVAASVTTSPPTPRIAYRNDDAMARALAERLVALAAASDNRWLTGMIPGITPPDGPRTLGVPAAVLDSTLLIGRVQAYLAALPSVRPATCLTVPRWPAGWVVTPLVDSRSWAIVRRGAPPAQIDRDGVVHFRPLEKAGP